MIDSPHPVGSMFRPAARQTRGVTLIEVMISMILVSTILLVSLTASANLKRNHFQIRNTNDGQQLGNQILDEITAMDFRDRVDPVDGLESGESAGNRSTFDDVDDYDGYSASPPTHRDGTAIEGYSGWSFSVNVTPAEPDATGITTTTDTESPLRLIVVTCAAPDGASVDVAALVSDTPTDAAETTSVEQWRRVKLTFPDREVNATVPLRNLPEPTYSP